MVPRASCPLVLPFGGSWWPYGPLRVEVSLAERGPGEHRCLVRLGAWRLLVDPSLPAAGQEGLLAPLAEALRQLGPRRPLEVSAAGPLPPLPGALLAADVATRLALGAAAGDLPPGQAVRSGRPTPAPPAGATAWLEERLLILVHPAPGEHAGLAPEEVGRGAFADADPTAWAAACQGQGLTASTPCEEDRLAAWTAGGLLGRWSLGEGAELALAAPDRRSELAGLLGEHGFEVHAPTFSGVRGAEVEEGE